MEVNPADVAGVPIRYGLGTAEFSIALSALYQLLLLDPQRGCSVLSGLRVAGVGTVPPPNGHLGGEYAVLG